MSARIRESAGGADDEQPTCREMPVAVACALHLVAFVDDGVRTHGIPAGATIVVGRSADCDVTVDSPEISRRHFAIVNDAQPLVRCLGSANGTRLNGRGLERHEQRVVGAGDVIEAGGILFALRDRAPATLRQPTNDVPAESRPPGAESHRPRAAASSPEIVIEHPAMVALQRFVEQVARSNLPVLVVGETGVGKEIVASMVHARSPRAAKPFVRINCAALPEALIESELFGYERGAFTGAHQSKAGLIESADGGTFLLDEVADLPRATQAKLLRVLECGELTRLGSVTPRALDVRFVAATNRPLPALVADGAFRSDLHYRISGVTVNVPPLRERRSEIRSLARLFLSAGARRARVRTPILSQRAINRLEGHAWPGNVRELRNVLEQALVLCGGDTVEAEHLLLDVGPPPPSQAGATHARTLVPEPPPGDGLRSPRGRIARLDEEVERRLIERALSEAAGNQGRAASILGVSRRTLVNRLTALGFARPRKG